MHRDFKYVGVSPMYSIHWWTMHYEIRGYCNIFQHHSVEINFDIIGHLIYTQSTHPHGYINMYIPHHTLCKNH